MERRKCKVDGFYDSGTIQWYCKICGKDKELPMSECNFCQFLVCEECIGNHSLNHIEKGDEDKLDTLIKNN